MYAIQNFKDTKVTLDELTKEAANTRYKVVQSLIVLEGGPAMTDDVMVVQKYKLEQHIVAAKKIFQKYNIDVTAVEKAVEKLKPYYVLYNSYDDKDPRKSELLQEMTVYISETPSNISNIIEKGDFNELEKIPIPNDETKIRSTTVSNQTNILNDILSDIERYSNTNSISDNLTDIDRRITFSSNIVDQEKSFVSSYGTLLQDSKTTKDNKKLALDIQIPI